jgi:hypothetical protein
MVSACPYSLWQRRRLIKHAKGLRYVRRGRRNEHAQADFELSCDECSKYFLGFKIFAIYRNMALQRRFPNSRHRGSSDATDYKQVSHNYITVLDFKFLNHACAITSPTVS